MHVIDLILGVIAGVLILILCALLARQTYLLRASGATPIAVRVRNRWQYGIARYVDVELRWYRALGLGPRPSRVLRRGEVTLVSRRAVAPNEVATLPSGAVVVEVRDSLGSVTLAFGESAFTGFVSWIEASSSRP